jgi:hypothetical protein
MDPRAWIYRKSLDQAKSSPPRTATDRSDQVLTGAQLAHQMLDLQGVCTDTGHESAASGPCAAGFLGSDGHRNAWPDARGHPANVLICESHAAVGDRGSGCAA